MSIELKESEGELGFEYDGIFITDATLSECGRFYVNPIEHYGLTLNTGIYGTTFFMLTGFHGFHVCLGAIILTIMLFRSLKGHFTADDHFGFEAGSWYWHFVDVVWILLVAFVYVM